MTALTDSRDASTNIMAIFNDSIPLVDGSESDFMTNWDCFLAFYPDGLISLHNPPGQHLVLFHAFNDNYAYGVFVFMYEKMWCSQDLSLFFN